MKLHSCLLFLCLFFCFQSFSQTVNNYGPFPKIKNSIVNINHLTTNYILLDKYQRSGTYRGARKKDDNYHILNTDSNSGFVSKKISHSHNSISGDVFQMFLTDKYIIEFISFVKPLSFQTGIGAVKRDCTTLEVIGDIKILDEDLSFSLLGPNANIQQTEEGYIYTRIVKNSYIISYLDNDFNELKQIILQDEVYKDQSEQQKIIDINPYSFLQVTDQDELVITKLLSNNKGESLNYYFTIVNPDGEVIDINPQINQTYPIRGLYINYSKDQKTIEGFFHYAESPKMKGFEIVQRGDEGYCYYKWNLDGQILESKSKSFSIDDVYGEYKTELLKKYSEKELGDAIMSNISTSHAIFTSEGNYMIINGLTWNSELRKSTFIIKTDKTGNHLWSKMLASTIANHVANFTQTPDNHLSILLQDFDLTNSNGSHQVDLSKKTNSKQPSSIFHILIDKNTGEFIENNVVNLDLPEGSMIKSIDLSRSKDKYLIESLQAKYSYFSVVSF